MASKKNVMHVQMMLKWAFGLVPILAGADKLLGLNILTEWEGYLAPGLVDAVGLDGAAIMTVVGIVEIVAGILVFVKTRLGAYLVALWMVLVALNLLWAGIYDVAVRDLVLAISAKSLAKLSE